MLFFVKILSHLPLKLLYLISDFLFFITYRLAGYRRKVVMQNIIKAFPEYSEVQVRATEKQFFSGFCDFIVETIKGFSIKHEEIRKRVVFTNLDEIQALFKKNKSILMLAAHQFNWEWMQLSASLQFPVPIDYIYQPLRNTSSDKMMLYLRNRFGARPIKRREAARQIIKRSTAGKGFALVADQLPTGKDKMLWVPFLNNETAFFYSIDQLAKLTNQPVAYFNIRRVRRGWYECKMTILSEEPRTEEAGDIIRKYSRVIEENIRKQPENWLWSHKRWKRKRSD